MAAGQFVNDQPQALLRHATLEVDRKEAIVSSGDYVDRHGRPCREPTGLAKYNVRLGSLV
jgi:hypothetical protein